MAGFRNRITPLAFDALVAVGLLAAALLSLANAGDPIGLDFGRSPDVLNYVVVAIMTLTIAARRRWPVIVLAVVVAAFVVDRLLDYPTTAAFWAIPMALHAVGSEIERTASRRIAVVASAGLVAFTAAGAITTDTVPWETVFIMAVFTIVPYLLGREVSERRERTASLEQRTAELERRQAEEARRAVRNERQRIARELHDVVAHEMTVMTLQAGAARRLIESDPTRAKTALRAVESAGHDALDEMRRLLDVLRPNNNETATAPQPGLARLDDLVKQMRDAGLDVAVNVDGDPVTLPVGVDLNVYRIVQESLTNALKHGGPRTKAWVDIGYAADFVALTISDDGRGAAGDLAHANGSGQGLVGMRERVALLHGDMSAGPRPGGGYQVRTRIPLRRS